MFQRKVMAIFMIGLMVAYSLLPINPQTSYAQASTSYSDIENSWAQGKIADWLHKGLITGYDDQTIRPDETISRAEFVTLVNRIFGYTMTSDQLFTDISKDQWYYKEIGKAKRAGYISGYEDATFRAEQTISRQEAAKIIYDLMKLNSETHAATGVAPFQDHNQIPSWSVNYVNTITAKGYIQGYPDHTFKPEQSITRAEAIVMLDRITGSLIQSPGTYGKADGQTIETGNVTINTKDVTLKNTVIQGDLYLAAGIGEGEITLDHVTVKGRTIVNGGGEHSIIIINSQLNEVFIEKISGNVRLVTQEDTVILKTIVKTGAKLEEESKGTGFTDVEILLSNSEDRVQLIGNFQNVNVEITAKLEILGNSTIDNLSTAVQADAASIFVESGSVLENIELNAAVHVTGEGLILFAKINVDGSTFEQTIVKFQLSDQVTFVIIANVKVTESSDEGNSGSGSPAPGNSDPVKTNPSAPVSQLGVQGVFLLGNQLYTKVSSGADFSSLGWSVSSSVTNSVYEAVYTGSGADYGVYATGQGNLPGLEYTVKRKDATDSYQAVMLSSVTIADSVYGYVYYGGSETIRFTIDQYKVTGLDQQLPVGAAPLSQGSLITLFFGNNLILEAVWDETKAAWSFSQFKQVIPLDAPINVKAVTISNTELGLSWDPVKNAEYYHIYYSDKLDGVYVPFTDQLGKKLQIEQPINGLYVDGGNLPHTTRYYKVTAANSTIESNFSSTVSATTYYNYHIPLGFEITDMVKHPTDPIVYMTDKANKQLHAVNIETEAVSSVTLNLPPEKIAFANGELYVTLLKGEHSSYWFTGQQGAIAIVDPATLAIKHTLDINIDPYDIAVDQNGYFYVSSGSAQWTEIKSYSRATLTEAASSGIRQQSYIHMHPTANKIYTITTDSSPRDITAYNVNPASGAFVEPSYPGGFDSPYHGDYAMNTNMKISPDGKYLFNGAGTVFYSSGSKYDDMRYVYDIKHPFADIAFNLDQGFFYTVMNQIISVHHYDNFKPTGIYHTDGMASRLFNGTNELIAASKLNTKNILEIVKKDSMEAAAPVTSAGLQFDGTIVDSVVNPANNLMYAIDESFHNLFTVDLGSQTIVNTMKLPYRPSGLALSEDQSKLYIVNDDENQLVTEINLSNYSVSRHLNYVSTPDSEDVSHRHITERAGKLYVVMGDWEPTLLLFDAQTFAQVNYGSAIRGIGDLVFASDNSRFYSWYQYGWSSGNAGSNVFAYSINGTTLAQIQKSAIGYPGMLRDPLDTPILLVENKNLLIAKDKVFNSNDLSQVVHTFPEPIYAVSPLGDKAVGKSGVYDLNTYALIKTLSLGTGAIPFFDNNGNLFYLKDSTLYPIK